MGLLRYLAAPLIGAVIGYFTNYIAVKMLFFPRREIYLFGKVLPFTPGAIPKGKPRLAKAVGGVVGNTLVTKEDIRSRLLDSETERKITDVVVRELSENLHDEIIKLTKCSEEIYDSKKNRLSELLSRQIVDELSASELPEIIVKKCNDSINEKLGGTMLAKLVNEEKIQSMTSPLVGKIRYMIEREGMDCVSPVIDSKLTEAGEKTGLEILSLINVDQGRLVDVVKTVYHRAVDDYLDRLFEKLDLAAMVENKINEMSVEEMERLVQSVMKKELGTIVNLGALIGFVLGLVNLLFK